MNFFQNLSLTANRQISFTLFRHRLVSSRFIMTAASKGSAKRKAAPTASVVDDKPEIEGQVKRQKASVDTLDVTDVKQAIPTNTKMPATYNYVQNDKELKIVAYNVNSINASLKKGLKEYLLAEDADILLLQETKLNEPNYNILSKLLYPHQFFSCSLGKKSYSGTAAFSKIKPLEVHYGINFDEDDEGRTITLEFEKFYVVGSYIVNAGEGLKRLDYKQKFDAAMLTYLQGLEKKKPVVWGGDLNVAHEEIDLARPKQNKNKTPGFTDIERADFSAILKECNMVDAFRHLYPTLPEAYTYFSYRFACRSKNLGWRLDYFVVSRTLLDSVKDSLIRSECYGASDHVPVVLILDKESLSL